MSTIAQWGLNLTTEASQSSTSSSGADNIFDSFHDDFISFLSIAQFHHVDFFPNTWDQDRNSLGRGATSDVKQSIVNLKTSFAFKRFTDPDHTNPNKKVMFRALISEVALLMQTGIMNHPNTVNLEGITFELGSDTAEVWPVLVFKRAQFGSIRSFMEKGGGRQIGFLHKIRLCSQVGSAIMAMHACDVIHGDIKPDNILIFGDTADGATAQVTDFGYSCIGAKDSDIVYLPMSRDWCAPEYHDRGIELHRAKKMDIYSYGMVCLWVLFGDEFVALRVDLERTNDRHQFHQSAMDLASTAETPGAQLRTFFELALCEDWQAREQDLEKLVLLLGQAIWKESDNPVEHARTLADYNATAEDIKDPEKLHLLTRKILHSWHLTGSEYRQMEDNLDSSKFAEWQKTEKYINLVLAGLSKFSVRSYEQETDLRFGLAHGCFNIANALPQLLSLDYRITIFITKSLETRTAQLSCERCRAQTAFQLAFCYTIGFGTPSDHDTARSWLHQSGLQMAELDRQLAHLRELKPLDVRIGPLAEYYASGLFHGRIACDKERLMAAKSHYERAISDLEFCLGPDHFLMLDMHGVLQYIAEQSGDWGAAAAIARHVGKICEEVHGADHLVSVVVRVDLARYSFLQNKWSEAEILLLEAKESLNRMEQHNHPFHLEIAECLSNVYIQTGRIGEAAALQSEASRRSMKVYGHHSIEQLSSMANTGWIHMNQGDLETAEDLLFRAKEGFKIYKERGHRGAIMASRNLALTYRKQGRILEAEEMQVDLKKTVENTFGPDHPETLNVLYDLARTYQIERRWAEAVEMFSKVKEGREKYSTVRDPLTIYPSSRIAEIYTEQGRLDEAEEMLCQIKEWTEQSLGHSDPDTLKAIRDLGIMYLSNGKLRKAQKTMEELMKRSEEVLGPHHEETLGSVANLGEVYRRQGRFDQAEEILGKAKKQMDAVLGPEHPYTQTVTNILASTYLDQGKIGEAFSMRLLQRPTTRFPGTGPKQLTQVPSPVEDGDDDEESILNAALAMSLVPDSDTEEDELTRRAIQLSLEEDNLPGQI